MTELGWSRIHESGWIQPDTHSFKFGIVVFFAWIRINTSWFKGIFADTTTRLHLPCHRAAHTHAFYLPLYLLPYRAYTPACRTLPMPFTTHTHICRTTAHKAPLLPRRLLHTTALLCLCLYYLPLVAPLGGRLNDWIILCGCSVIVYLVLPSSSYEFRFYTPQLNTGIY